MPLSGPSKTATCTVCCDFGFQQPLKMEGMGPKLFTLSALNRPRNAFFPLIGQAALGSTLGLNLSRASLGPVLGLFVALWPALRERCGRAVTAKRLESESAESDEALGGPARPCHPDCVRGRRIQPFRAFRRQNFYMDDGC